MASRTLLTLVCAGVLADLTARCSQVALPLVALAATGSTVQTGLVSGTMALPLVLSPWWARRIRHRVAGSGMLGVLTAVQALGVLVIPLVAAAHALGTTALVASGILVGTARTLTLPGRQALLADVEQAEGGSGATVLAWQEAASRATSILGPALGAVAVGAGLTLDLLVLEAVALFVAAAMTAWTRATPAAQTDETPSAATPSIRQALHGQRDIARGWIIRGIAGFIWFAFGLGLAIDSARDDHPGLYYAIGVSAYGLGSVTATLIAGHAAWIRPTLRLAAAGWAINGVAWISMGWWTSPLGYGVGGLLSGIGAGVGFATITRLIAIRTQGATRRALLSGQLMVVESTTAVGMLIGGAVIAGIGVPIAFVVTGTLLLVTTACCVLLRKPADVVRPIR